MRAAVYVDKHPEVRLNLGIAKFYSLFDSPYPSHKRCTALDIYFGTDEALFPFDEGRVIEIKWFEIPKRRRDGTDREPLIVIHIEGDLIAKVLHVDPRVKIGEKLVYGDPIGKLILSGYLYPWSEKHMHLEIRSLRKKYGVLHGYRIKVLNLDSVEANDKIYGIVEEVHEHYVLVKPIKSTWWGPTPLYIEINRDRIFIEGGYPHYGYIAMLSIRCLNAFNCVDIGELSAYVAITNRKYLEENSLGIDGVATYMGRELVKLVSRNPIDGISEGDIVEMDIRPYLLADLHISDHREQ